MRPLAALALALVAASCNRPGRALGPLPEGGIRVLFVGNSLTYTNDLPRMLAGIAASVDDTVQHRTVALPNYAVIDHAFGLSDALEQVKRGRWEFVVLQQGPTPAGLDRDTLVLAARLFDPHVRAAGGRTVSLMTWPSRQQQAQYPRLFDQTAETCLATASPIDGLCAPGGEGWRRAWAADASLPLYGPDGYHPSELGTYLAALVLYETLTGRDARTLPLPGAGVAGPQAPAATIRLLQRSAHEAIEGMIPPPR